MPVKTKMVADVGLRWAASGSQELVFYCPYEKALLDLQDERPYAAESTWFAACSFQEVRTAALTVILWPVIALNEFDIHIFR